MSDQQYPQTIMKKVLKPTIFITRPDLCSEQTEFEIFGQNGGPSYEDRTVYFSFKPLGKSAPVAIPEVSVTPVSNCSENETADEVCGTHSTTCHSTPDHCFMQAEEAIALGQLLIEHGTNAFLSNMYGHQAYRAWQQYQKYVAENRIRKTMLTVVDENPANYGPGYRAYLIEPAWEINMAPEFDECFKFELPIYWSPFEEQYQQQLANYKNPEIIGYDREAELIAFKKWCEAYI